MTSKKTFLQTATLIEDILGVKKVSYVLQQVDEQMGEDVSDISWNLNNVQSSLKEKFFHTPSVNFNYFFVLLKYIQV